MQECCQLEQRSSPFVKQLLNIIYKTAISRVRACVHTHTHTHTHARARARTHTYRVKRNLTIGTDKIKCIADLLFETSRNNLPFHVRKTSRVGASYYKCVSLAVWPRYSSSVTQGGPCQGYFRIDLSSPIVL